MITTHVLDISRGKPAGGVPVILEFGREGGKWKLLGKGATDQDGRIRDLIGKGDRLSKGTYRLTFETGDYFRKMKTSGFYPVVQVIFEIRDPKSHYHVPLLLSPYGYSTYRGS